MDRINADPSRAYSAEDFQDLSTGQHPLQYVRSSLYRLVKSKKLKKSGRGKFRVQPAGPSNGTTARGGA
jgi:hypothetical protein